MDEYRRTGGGGGATGVGGWGGGATGVDRWGGWAHHQQEPKSHQIVKAATAVLLGGSLLVLSGLTLAVTVIALTIATPLLVIFSPVLVPAVIAVFLLVTGFLASGGFGIAAVSVLVWIYQFVTGQHPVGADQLEQARMKLAGKARDVRDTAREQFGTTGHHYTTTTTTTT